LKAKGKLIITRLMKEHIIEVDDLCFEIVDQACINLMRILNHD